MTKPAPIKIIIADTSFIVRKGLQTLISENEKFENVGEAIDDKSLKIALSQQKADVLIVDHCCDDCFSIEMIREVKSGNPDLNILVISHERSAEEIKKLIGLGVKNYVLKDSTEKEITDAIKACAKGEKYFCKEIINVLIEKEITSQENYIAGNLSDREVEMIKELATGIRPKEIAKKMNLSYHTIVTHKRNIYSKLGITNSIELAHYAVKNGLMKQ